jgi:hypothetical protein
MAILTKAVTTKAPNIIDAFGAGAVKFAEERILASTPVGNGTLVSGAVKLGIGVAANKFIGGGFLGNSVSLGFTVDGVEDVLTAVMGRNFGLGGQSTGRPGWAS